MLHILDHQKSLASQFLAEMRDQEVQKDRLRFRHNMKRMGVLLATEISKHMDYEQREVITPLGTTEQSMFVDHPVIATILRAGIPMHEGMMEYFDQADAAFISAFRKHTGNNFDIEVGYISSPDIQDRILILTDPMLATGSTILKSYKALLANGRPRKFFLASIIASEEGVDFVRKHIPECQLFVGAVDVELTSKAYIVPGLGDAGDLAFGEKI